MGREAVCTCIWNGKKYQVKAPLEPPDLIPRGDLRHRVPLAEITGLEREGDYLLFHLEANSVRLHSAHYRHPHLVHLPQRTRPSAQ